MIILKSQREIEIMRRAGLIVARAHEKVKEAIRPGVTTQELDDVALEVIESEGATSAFKGYNGFPANICVSVNEEVVHGIPGKMKLKEGDVVSVDIGAVVDGYYGDSAWTYTVGEPDESIKALLDAGEISLAAGIEKAIVGNRLSDISHAVQVEAEARGFSVVRDFVGHGIGRAMHEAPQIPNFGPPGQGPILKAGMVLAIEPMINVGVPDVKVLSDGWTVVTADGEKSVHFEHTVAITEDGPLILTRND